ncbi:MAG: hypothetical protein JNL11_05495 [Bdellovibrionaceae bacterium]|nr:hypothetical protein [Pseudobdellovibrionaceae bacterium]
MAWSFWSFQDAWRSWAYAISVSVAFSGSGRMVCVGAGVYVQVCEWLWISLVRVLPHTG